MSFDAITRFFLSLSKYRTMTKYGEMTTIQPLKSLNITLQSISNASLSYVMDLRGWEYLWKILATIGVANLFFFVIIVHVFAIDNPIVIWTLIVIEFSYYLCLCVGISVNFNANI